MTEKKPRHIEELALLRQSAWADYERIDAELKARVRAEYAEGQSLRALAKRARVTHPTISKWVER